jgi:valyl-tRNA synthetase
MSTLGWPNEKARDLAAFYPTDVLVTAPEILFFWVARMIMAGYAFLGRAPYHTVYLHGTARDTQHRKMSKSLGNGIDPLDVVSLYGADALRWTLIAGMGLGADVILDPADIEKSFATGRNFATKLWNIGRFLLSNLGDAPVRPLADIDPVRYTAADAWILQRLNGTIAECDGALGPLMPTKPSDGADGRVWREDERYAGLRLNEFAEAARRFVWNELADWYLESLKGRLGGDAEPEDREVARSVLLHVFDAALRLLHPIVPFVTEALWQKLPGRREGELLIRAPWPRWHGRAAPERAAEFELVREAVLAVRQIRGDYNVAPAKQVEVAILARADRATYEANAGTIGRLARARVAVATGPAPDGAAHAVLRGGSEVIVPLAGLIDVDKECQRLRSELGALEKQIVSREQRLANPKYVERAPEHVVKSDRATLDEMISKREQLTEKVRTLCGA